MGLFLIRGFGHRDHPIITGINGAGESSDRSAFAGGIPTLEDKDNGAARRVGAAPPGSLALSIFLALPAILFEGQGEQTASA